MDATAAGREHTWTVDMPEEPVTVLGDRQQLAQLVANLLSNARKHTPEGTNVLVRLQERAAAGLDTAQLTVQDDGPGIDPDLLPGLFDRFVRGDTARTTREGSTGWGATCARGPRPGGRPPWVIPGPRVRCRTAAPDRPADVMRNADTWIGSDSHCGGGAVGHRTGSRTQVRQEGKDRRGGLVI